MSLICLTMVDLPLSPAPSIKALTVRLEEGGQHSGSADWSSVLHIRHSGRQNHSRLFCPGPFEFLIDGLVLLLSERGLCVD